MQWLCSACIQYADVMLRTGVMRFALSSYLTAGCAQCGRIVWRVFDRVGAIGVVRLDRAAPRAVSAER